MRPVSTVCVKCMGTIDLVRGSYHHHRKVVHGTVTSSVYWHITDCSKESKRFATLRQIFSRLFSL